MSHTCQEVPRIPETVDFPSEELKILSLWDELDAFRTCVSQSKGKPRYSFYDGPPFVTGVPHYGNILAATLKDVVTRYAHQRGFYVERRFGWDCHGLPVEFELDKTLGIKGSEDVERIGVDKYNNECRKIVTRYVEEWKIVMSRIGRWIDFDNDYKTLYPWFMESVWWVFKQLFLKGFVYHGNKIMPYSTACHTPLSNFESGQNYKEVTDPAVTVSLPIIGDKQNAALLVWTTTPWTLPSNLAACVNPRLVYARIKEISTGQIYVLMKSRADFVFKSSDYEILEEFLGVKLKGLRYEPIFPYYAHMSHTGAFTVVNDEYVSAESGTGVVHQAPYFGEDDFRVCLAAGIVTRDQQPICPIDENGRLTKPVLDFEGQYFKDADKNIIAALKATNRLVRSSQVKHSYPFCWRSDTPLVYKAIPSWFVRVHHMSDLLQESTSKTYWVPEFMKGKRFGNWLKEARDWAVSRNRYWGTPIPIWSSPDGSEICCVGSIAELEELTGMQIKDLHRENIDHLVIPSRTPGNPPLRRIPEVFDCWFESGSMPYAQKHFPFENSKEFDECFPADFIAEGIDQTRGWFYTLLVISTALFGKAPFRNVIANGLILASDGQKMSKRKRNYPDPMEVVSKYGADALRLYLINSPVVRAENLRFKEEGVRDTIKDVFLPWFNAFRFLMQNIEMYVGQTGQRFYYSEAESSNLMDQWILSFTQSLLEYVHQEMDLYHLYSVVPRLTRYFDHLTNWYVRMNRKRLKGEVGEGEYQKQNGFLGEKCEDYGLGQNRQKGRQDQNNLNKSKNQDRQVALMTLFDVLLTITKIMAPFVPFLSEYIYQHLKPFTSFDSKSVHFLMLPDPETSFINRKIERAVSRLQEVVELGRILRDKSSMPIKYPLPEIVVIHHDPQYLADVKSLEPYILSEMNVRKLTFADDKEKFGIKLQAKPDYKALGMRFKSNYKKLAQVVESLTDGEINLLITNGHLDIRGNHIEISFVRLIFKTESISLQKYAMQAQNDVLVLLDVHPDRSMLEEGAAREIINRIQKLRKKAHLVPSDQIDVFYTATKELKAVAQSYSEFIQRSIRANFLPIEDRSIADQLIVEESRQFKGCSLRILLTRKVNLEVPVVKWANVLVRGFGKDSKGLILLEAANEVLMFEDLKSNIQALFNIYVDFALWSGRGHITNGTELDQLTGQTILVLPLDEGLQENFQEVWNLQGSSLQVLQNGEPFCKVLNFFRQDVSGTIILENPAGTTTVAEKDYQAIINEWVTRVAKNVT